MEGKHIGCLCASLNSAIREYKVFDKCLPGLPGQFVISGRIFLPAQDMCDPRKQAAAIGKKCRTDQFLRRPTLAPITAIQGEPVTKTMPALIFGVTAQPVLTGPGQKLDETLHRSVTFVDQTCIAIALVNRPGTDHTRVGPGRAAIPD